MTAALDTAAAKRSILTVESLMDTNPQACGHETARPRRRRRPAKRFRGHESQAMLCDAGHADGLVPALLQPEWPLPNGTRAA